MKKINIVLAIILMLALSVPSQKTKAQGVPVSFQVFYDNLSPYGTWISYPQYGYVWQPNVSREFHPYRTSGHWAWSDRYQWIWISDYEWGWAPFHYGRWFYDDFYGWLWIPDYEWAPAWVLWRGGDDYYGWAPLGPGITYGNYYSPPHSYWCFTPRRYITSPVIYKYYISPQQNPTIINNTTVINVSGPARTEVEKYTQQSITPVQLSESSSPGRTIVSGNEVTIYKPKVSVSDKSSAKPSKVVTAKVNEPQKEQQVITESQKNQPVKTEPQKQEPIRTEPQKNQPIKTEPQKSQPVIIEPRKTQPVRTEPQQNQPVKTEPQKTQPMKTEPQKQQPMKTEPPKQQPMKTEPPKQQPMKTEPPKQQPVKTEPTQPPQSQPQKTEPKNPPPKKKDGK